MRGVGDFQEGAETSAYVRIAAGDGGVEWAQVRALLARDTRTPMGRERALGLLPTQDLEAITHALDETRQGRAALALAGPPPWEIIPDVRPTLDAVRVPGAVADGIALAAMIPLLDAATRLTGYGRGIREAAPDLAAAFADFPSPKPLADLLRRSLEEDGSVRDEASPALRRIRSRLRDLRKDIVRTLEAYFQSPAADTIFQERYVTVRHGRFVLPVAAGAKSRMRGIVHDRSQSGATLFIEPEGVVEANNELVQAIREEESEILRVLAALTDAVRDALPELEALLAGMAQLDLVFARAELGERMAATQPLVSAERVVVLRAARNPLLLAQAEKEPGRAVVPVDIELDGARPLLVITGPNAGGKTVTLKTLALLALMAQSGLHIPADDGARLPVFSQVFAIVGDDQSVAENLSTFSAFVKQLRDVLEHVDERSLVVLDELGAGTDPDDGAALAQAVLEELAQRGALCIASTHLEPLKGFASTHPRARNASVEFDQERLAPTFRLVYDRPGQSYALAIGARLGLAPDADRARVRLSLGAAASAPGAPGEPGRSRPARSREHRDDRAARGRERRAPQPGRGRARGGAHGGARHAGARAGRGQAGGRGHPARGQRGVGAPAPRREDPRRSHAEPPARARRGGSGGPSRRRARVGAGRAGCRARWGRAIASRSRISASRERYWRWTAARPRCGRER